MGRDNFTKRTIDVLAKRVGFLCSNPECRKHTVGPNSDNTKFSLIGIAAHLSAASPGGPRFNQFLTEGQRRHIDNAIWLCSNCATLIDKDHKNYSISLLENWKIIAEYEMVNRISSNKAIKIDGIPKPFIEADLIYTGGMRLNRGYSPKNRDKFNNNIITVGGKPIIFWEINWKFRFVLFNNSSFPAYNIGIKTLGRLKFRDLKKLPKVNNLPPFQSIDLIAETTQFIEGEHTEADALLNKKFPDSIQGVQFSINYKNDIRSTFVTKVEIIGLEAISTRLIDDGKN